MNKKMKSETSFVITCCKLKSTKKPKSTLNFGVKFPKSMIKPKEENMQKVFSVIYTTGHKKLKVKKLSSLFSMCCYLISNI